jgi:hypothetical protein
MIDTTFRGWPGQLSRRAGLLLIVLLVLILLGFYTVTDTARLEHNLALDGADYVGYAVCHRLTDHSLSIAGRQLPLCGGDLNFLRLRIGRPPAMVFAPTTAGYLGSPRISGPYGHRRN